MKLAESISLMFICVMTGNIPSAIRRPSAFRLTGDAFPNLIPSILPSYPLDSPNSFSHLQSFMASIANLCHLRWSRWLTNSSSLLGRSQVS